MFLMSAQGRCESVAADRRVVTSKRVPAQLRLRGQALVARPCDGGSALNQARATGRELSCWRALRDQWCSRRGARGV